MRIALITDTYTPQVNGVTTVLRRMVEGLAERGHDVAMVAPRYPTPAPIGPAREHRVASVPFPPYPDIRLSAPRFRRVGRFLEAFRPDLVHVATEGPLGFVGRRWAVSEAVPLVTSFHTDFPRYCRDYGVGGLAPVVWRWLRWFHAAAGLTHAPGRCAKTQLEAHGIEPVEVWGCGVDGRRFRPDRRDQTLRRRLGAPNGRPLVLHVGRLAPEKSVDVLIEAWATARRTLGERAEFVIAGDGPLASRIELAIPWVRRLGFLDRDDLADLYASADMCVLPSETETCGLVALEAMASGTPVIAADAGGLAESVGHEVNGLLVAPRDASGFAAAIVRLAMEPDFRRHLGANARRVAETRDMRVELDRLIEQYASLIDHPNRTPTWTAA